MVENFEKRSDNDTFDASCEKRIKVEKYIDGASALKLIDHTDSSQQGRLIVFQPEALTHKSCSSHYQSKNLFAHIRSMLVHQLDKSEMACSLRYEGSAGCSYKMFSLLQIVIASVLFVGIGFIAVVLESI